jgi:hypothetical protein
LITVHVPAKVFLDVISISIPKRFGLSLTYLGLVDNGWTGWVDGRVGERMSCAQVEGLTAEWVVETECLDKRMGSVKTEQLGKEALVWTDECVKT